MEVKEALQQMRDDALMDAAMIAYKHGRTHPKDAEAANMIGDAIRALMRPQR